MAVVWPMVVTFAIVGLATLMVGGPIVVDLFRSDYEGGDND